MSRVQDSIVDDNFDIDGMPKWFDYILSGFEPKKAFDEATGHEVWVPKVGTCVTFEWPVPQETRIGIYAHMAARDIDAFDE